MALPPLKPPRKRKVGFAAMDPERQRELARMGGAAVPAHKRAFAKDKQLAIEAAVKGGKASHGGGRPKGTHTAAHRAQASRMGQWTNMRRNSMHPANPANPNKKD